MQEKITASADKLENFVHASVHVDQKEGSHGQCGEERQTIDTQATEQNPSMLYEPGYCCFMDVRSKM